MLNTHIQIHGHRGARGLYPENTITAFIEAVKLGVHAIEMDVVVSKDLKIVVSHEEWMNNVFCLQPNGKELEFPAKEKYNLYNMFYSDIALFDCGSKKNVEFPHQQHSKEHKPLLSEVVHHVETFIKKNNLAPVIYNIEIKSDVEGDNIFHPTPSVFVALLFDVLNRLLNPRQYMLQSFDVRIVQAIRSLKPEVSLGLLIENDDSCDLNLKRLGFKPDFYNPDFYLVTPQLMQTMRDQNIRVIPWTVNETEDMSRLIYLEVNGIITDYPNRAIELIKSL